MIVNITVEYNNIEDPNGPEAEEIIQNLNLKITQGVIKNATYADSIYVQDVEVIDENI